MILSNQTRECFQQIKDAIKGKIGTLGDDCKIYTRMRYADNFKQWLEIAAIEVANESRLQVIFIYLSDFRSERKEFRTTSVSAKFIIEVIYQFREGTDSSNSTLDFENKLGDINDLFKEEESLGFTDISSFPVLNLPISGDPDNGGSPEYVDGVLAHRKLLNFEVTFRTC